MGQPIEMELDNLEEGGGRLCEIVEGVEEGEAIDIVRNLGWKGVIHFWLRDLFLVDGTWVFLPVSFSPPFQLFYSDFFFQS